MDEGRRAERKNRWEMGDRPSGWGERSEEAESGNGKMGKWEIG
jgi:hypothetical protein